MMFNSLRSRLWLSYALLIALVLCFIGGAITLVVIRGNIPLQQAALRLQALRASALPRLRLAGNIDANMLQTLLDRNADAIKGRIVILTSDGKIIADSMGKNGGNLPEFGEAPLRTEVGALPQFYRDDLGQSWYYIIDGLNPNRLVYFAVYRPKFQIISILRDQYLGPLVKGGIFALFASIIFSLVMARWISKPIYRISQEARQVAEAQAQPIPLKGPAEVRNLVQAFNDMALQVHDSQESQKSFVANVSHDLKTPITSIQGFARAILDGTVETESELKQAVEVIESEAGRMDRLVTDLLTLAKLDAGTSSFEMQNFDINDLLRASARKFSQQMANSGLDFKVDFPSKASRLYGDPDRLMQVFDNLLTNAIKFTPEGGVISFYSQVHENTINVHVVDSGKGIPPSEQERVFERFYQVDKSRSGGENRGYGLGLAIAKQLVEAHNGSISFTSKPGEGSHFVVKLPLQT